MYVRYEYAFYRNDSKSKQYDDQHSFPVTAKESLKTDVTNAVVTPAPKLTTETYGNTKLQHHPQNQKQDIQSTIPKLVNQTQGGGSVHYGGTVSTKSVTKSAKSMKTSVSAKPVQAQSEVNTSDTLMLETIKSDESEKLHETESKIIDQLTERVAKMETESMQKITSISNRMEDELTKTLTSLTGRLNHKEEEIASQDKRLLAMEQLLKCRDQEWKQRLQKNERGASQEITALNEGLKQSKRENATMVEGLQERLQLKENRLAVVNQKINDLQERLQEKEDDTNQKVTTLTDSLEQTKRESNHKITALSDRLLLKEEELTAVNQEFSAFQERTQEVEIQQQERMQVQETQLQTFCNNALQQMREQIETQMHQQIQQVTNQMTMMEKLFNAVKPQWLISRHEITLTQRELGNGGWGRVVQATFRSKQVAAKCLHHQIICDYNIQQFVREMQISSKCHHPNLLRFLGATLEGNPIILTELMDTNLYDVIRRHELKDHQVVLLLQDIAGAINYLHNLSPEPIIHRDIASSNVLLSGPVRSKWIVKLSDFGSANFLWHTSEQSRAPGNPTYAAPEVLSPHNHSEKMDVYSFGVLLFEICSSQAPSLQLRNEVLPTAAAVWPEPHRHFVPLIVSCTRDNKDERPTMSDVLAEL